MSIRDTGTVFEIVPHLRKVTVPQNHKTLGTVGEHLAEQITFKCPQLIDGHDITTCAEKFVVWLDAAGDPGSDGLTLVRAEDGYAYFTWDITEGLTASRGVVSFSVNFRDVGDDGKLLFRFCTTTCTDCDILDSLNAVLGTYEKIYVSGNKLVIADFTPVYDKKLALDANPNGKLPTATLDITENGEGIDVVDYAYVNVAVDVPTETLDITENANDVDVLNYAKVNVNVKQPDEGKLVITENTTEPMDIRWKETLEVNVPQPSGKTTITENFQKNVNVKDYEYVDVEIPYPTATKIVRANDVYPCHGYGFVDVRVGEWEATKTLEITDMGTLGDGMHYTNGAGKVKIIPGDLHPNNIAYGKTILGVTGVNDLQTNASVEFYNNTGNTVTINYGIVNVSENVVSRSMYTIPLNSGQLYEGQVECNAFLIMRSSARFALQIDGPGNVAASDSYNVLVHPVHFAPRSKAYKVAIVSA